MNVDRNAFTANQLAYKWQVSEETVRSLCKRKELSHFRLGGRLLRIPVSSVEEYECKKFNTSSESSEASSQSSGTKMGSGEGTALARLNFQRRLALDTFAEMARKANPVRHTFEKLWVMYKESLGERVSSKTMPFEWVNLKAWLADIYPESIAEQTHIITRRHMAKKNTQNANTSVTDGLSIDDLLNGAAELTEATAEGDEAVDLTEATELVDEEANEAVSDTEEVDGTEDEEVADDDIEFSFGELPPEARAGGRGGPRGSKYGFEKFPKPTDPKKLPFRLIPAGDDAEKTKRSIYSAQTVANKRGKDPKDPMFGAEFRTRAATDKPGFLIFRIK